MSTEALKLAQSLREIANEHYLELTDEAQRTLESAAKSLNELVAESERLGLHDGAQQAQGVPVAMPPILVRALAKRKFRGATDADDLFAMAANVILEDQSVIAHLQARLAAAPQAGQQVAREPSPTAGMTLAQRILHVGGRNNAAGYVEFGSTQAVEALVRQVLRDLPAEPQKAQGVLADADLARVAYQGYDSYWTENCLGDETEAWAASAKAVLTHCAAAPHAEKAADAHEFTDSVVREKLRLSLSAGMSWHGQWSAETHRHAQLVIALMARAWRDAEQAHGIGTKEYKQ
ncbi:hypothetical protein LNV47_22550 [Paucibacter sp. DJ4R-1]|nr:hypothetical protein [Paucibacter sp. DJ4R-1]